MTRRNLVTESGLVLGYVDDDGPEFGGQADDVFRGMRRRFGDQRAADLLVAEGWSNGMGSLFLSPVDS